MHSDRALLKAIKYVGSQSALARLLKVPRVRVNHWLNRNKQIPFEYAMAIEQLTGGVVHRYELAPYAKWLEKIKPLVSIGMPVNDDIKEHDMSRIRTIKPELFRHEALFEAEDKTQLPLRLAFMGLFTCCDCEGRFRWKPRQLKLDILPYDDINFEAILNALHDYGFIQRYEIDDEGYGYIPSWLKHQHINAREPASKLPAPPPMNKNPIPLTPKHVGDESTCDLPESSLPQHRSVQTLAKEQDTTVQALVTPHQEQAMHVQKPAIHHQAQVMHVQELDADHPEQVMHVQELDMHHPEQVMHVQDHVMHVHALELHSQNHVMHVQELDVDHPEQVMHVQTLDTHMQVQALHVHARGEREKEQEKEEEGKRNGNGIARARPVPDHEKNMLVVFHHWQKTFDYPNAKLDAKRQSLILQALQAGYTVAQLCQAISGCAETPHNMGDNRPSAKFR